MGKIVIRNPHYTVAKNWKKGNTRNGAHLKRNIMVSLMAKNSAL